jgi:type II secretory pathway pseudopilin PulG
MIAVVIIGLLAALAIPSFQRVQQRSQISRFASDLRTFSQGLETLMLELGTLPGDPSSGTLSGGHAQLSDYISAGKFAQPTSLGGVWDIDSGDFGVRCVVGVDLGGAPDAIQLANLTAVDALIDDGDLTTGSFRAFNSNRRGYLLIE